MKICTTADRLKELMSAQNLRQVDILNRAKPFCEQYQVKLGKNDLSQYVNGKVEPGQEKLTILGLALDVSETWLMGYDVPMGRTPSAPQERPLPSNILPFPKTQPKPRIGSIACGVPILAEQNIEGYDLVPDYIQCDFTLVCKGDSMINARIFDGDIVCVRQQPEVESGEIAAVMVGDDEATLKRVRLFDDHISLEAENPMCKPLVFWGEEMNQVRIIGKATHFISTVR